MSERMGGRRRGAIAGALIGAALLAAACSSLASAPAEAWPEIRTSERNGVPACVTPEKLNRFLADGNRGVLPQFRDIAKYYKQHGEHWRVRWDYAFYQMVIETNYLKFVNNAGQGDVKPRQNNFAGIGTTGGGVPGDSYPDVSTGVLAQIQHLVVYSGERIPSPVGPRTREKQDEILAKSKSLGRPVTWQDLSGRWAVDRRYGRSIEFIAARFRQAHCNGQPDSVMAAAPDSGGAKVAAVDPDSGKGGRGKKGKRRGRAAPEEAVASAPAVVEESGAAAVPAAAGGRLAGQAVADGKAEANDRRAGLGMPDAASGGACSVQTASYGGKTNVLIRARNGAELQYTALQVIEGEEKSLADTFIRSHAAGGEAIGQFPSRDAALAKAFELCPETKARQ